MRLAATVLALCGCGRIDFDPLAADACARTGAFEAPVLIDGPFRTPGDEWFPTPSADERALYFYAFNPPHGFDIMLITRATIDASWSDATPLAVINGNADDKGPTLTADELDLVFTSIRTTGNYDMYEATRASKSDDFSAPVAIAALNTSDQEQAPWLSGDGLRLLYRGADRITESTRASRGGAWSAPVVHTELILGGIQDSPTTTADGLDLWFAATTPTYDVYSTHRASLAAPFDAPVRNAVLSSSRDDLGLRLSSGGTRLYMNYNTLYGGQGNADLSVASRACE